MAMHRLLSMAGDAQNFEVVVGVVVLETIAVVHVKETTELNGQSSSTGFAGEIASLLYSLRDVTPVGRVLVQWGGV